MEPFVPPTSSSFFSMIWALSVFAKIIILILLTFSVVCWAIIFNKFRLFRRARKNNRFVYEMFKSRTSVLDFYAIANEYPNSHLSKLVVAGNEEWQKITSHNPSTIPLSGSNPVSVKSETIMALLPNINEALNRTASLEVEHLEKSLSFLATTGSVSPFIGLLGTVWGIIEAFVGIRHMPVVTLQIIAPGISDALVVTAAGLLVAVPAVVAFNYYLGQVRKFSAEMDRWSQEIISDFRKAAVKFDNN